MRRKDKLIAEIDPNVEEGVSNPTLVSDHENGMEMVPLHGETSAEVVNETESLLHDLSLRRRRKQHELSKLKADKSKQDLASEVKFVKEKSRETLEEERMEQESTAANVAVAEDGTVPMSDLDEDTVDAPEPLVPQLESAVFESTEEKKVKQAAERDVITGGKFRNTVKDKLKNRLRKAKNEAASEVKKEVQELKRERRLKELRDRTVTRFDTSSMDELESERQAEEKISQLKERWRKASKTVGEQQLRLPSPREAMDFFTRTWEPEPVAEEERMEGREMKTVPSEETTPEAEASEDVGKQEDTVPILEDILEDEGYGLVAIRKAEYISYQKLHKAEKKLLFVPKGLSVPPSDKIFEEEEFRCLADEGFYVGSPPEIALRNRNKMERRLLQDKEKAKKWFGKDGCIISLPNPLKEAPSRPPVPEEQEPLLGTVYRMAVMQDFDSRFIDGTMDGSRCYQLDIDINAIVFTHNHLFSREHILAVRLNNLYKQYVSRKKKNMVHFLSEKLKTLRISSLHLQDNILAHKSQQSEEEKCNSEKRINDYKAEIRQLRSQRDKEEQCDRMLLKNLIHSWREIKHLREFQNYTNTTFRLQIKKEEMNRTQDDFLWRQEIDDELDEARDEYEKEYAKKLAVYQQQLEQWQNQQQAWKEALKRKKKRDRRRSKNLPVEDEEEEQKDEKILQEEPDKPVAPEKFDERSMREKIRSKALEYRRRPGEPVLHPELSNSSTITPTNQCPRGEQQRREAVSKSKIFIKILFNNKEVSRTTAKPLSEDFKVVFGQIYNLKIVQWPESISLQVYQNTGLSNLFLAELYVGIPKSSVSSDSVQFEHLDFSSDMKIHYNHEAVGSGVPISFDKNNEVVLYLATSGILTCSASWAVDENGVPLVPPSYTADVNRFFSTIKKMDPLAALGATNAVNRDKLYKWASEAQLDVNDPQNADLIYLLKPQKESGGFHESDYFRLEQLQEEFNFATDEEIEFSKRFKLLQYRSHDIQEFRNCKMVPAFDREIPKDAFADYEKRKRGEERLDQIKDIESHRALVSPYMQRVREQVLHRLKYTSQEKRLEEVVNEEAVPNIAMLGVNLLKLFQPRRPLKPKRMERKKVTAQGIKGDEVKILINIIQAFNIPTRNLQLSQSPATSRGTAEQFRQGFLSKEITVRPFVEVMFQRNTVRTSVADGPNPSFNEELEIPFTAPNNDYSTSNLQTVSDILYFNLFDEILVDVLEDQRQRATDIHKRVEKKWLGGLKIPFSTIYFNGKIDGTIQLRTPPVLLGYSIPTQNRRTTESDVCSDFGIARHTHLNLFITIEPPLIPPEAIREKFTSNESEKLLQYAENWSFHFEQKFPQRAIKTTVVDISGRAVLATRYIKALKPPEELIIDKPANEAAEILTRFVSLIPFVSDAMLFPGRCNIWSSCDQFMRMLAGDEEEHAVLLTNYFLGINKKAWLCIGYGIPEGETAYVLTQEERDYWIWNASTGQHFSCHENLCPLQRIGCLIGSDNIWANIQKFCNPARMNFDVNSTSCWKPFFHRGFPYPGLSSIQVENLVLIPTDVNFVLDLQEKIEQNLRNKIMEWRHLYVTRWNRYFTQSIRNLLQKLEVHHGRAIPGGHLSELDDFLSSYKVSGFPLNMPFMDLAGIIEAVFATGVHDYHSSEVEFSLAVYIHSYPNSVLSVWIYLASLVRI